MTFKVIIHAFSTPRLRTVTIPGEPGDFNVNEVLDLIFKYGQNDFQPQNCPSVSVGDFILFENGDVHEVMDFGFRKLDKVN